MSDYPLTPCFQLFLERISLTTGQKKVNILFLMIFVVFKINSSISFIYERIQDVQYSREVGGWNCNLVLFTTSVIQCLSRLIVVTV